LLDYRLPPHSQGDLPDGTELGNHARDINMPLVDDSLSVNQNLTVAFMFSSRLTLTKFKS